MNSYLKKEKMSQLDLAVEKLYDAVRIRTDIEYEEKRMIPGTLKGFPDSKDLEKLSEGEFAEIFTKVYRLPENSDPCFWAGVWIDATQKEGVMTEASLLKWALSAPVDVQYIYKAQEIAEKTILTERIRANREKIGKPVTVGMKDVPEFAAFMSNVFMEHESYVDDTVSQYSVAYYENATIVWVEIVRAGRNAKGVLNWLGPKDAIRTPIERMESPRQHRTHPEWKKKKIARIPKLSELGRGGRLLRILMEKMKR